MKTKKKGSVVCTYGARISTACDSTRLPAMIVRLKRLCKKTWSRGHLCWNRAALVSEGLADATGGTDNG